METNHMIFELIFGVRRDNTARTKSGEVPAPSSNLAVLIGKVELSVDSDYRNPSVIRTASHAILELNLVMHMNRVARQGVYVVELVIRGLQLVLDNNVAE